MRILLLQLIKTIMGVYKRVFLIGLFSIQLFLFNLSQCVAQNRKWEFAYALGTDFSKYPNNLTNTFYLSRKLNHFIGSQFSFFNVNTSNKNDFGLNTTDINGGSLYVGTEYYIQKSLNIWSLGIFLTPFPKKWFLQLKVIGNISYFHAYNVVPQLHFSIYYPEGVITAKDVILDYETFENSGLGKSLSVELYFPFKSYFSLGIVYTLGDVVVNTREMYYVDDQSALSLKLGINF